MSEFVHLAVHSEYSLIDSTVRVKPLIKSVLSGSMPAVALTDQSNMFALVKFFRAAEADGVKPLAGADILVDHGDGEDPARLILLCQNRTGFLSLSRLLSKGYAQRTLKTLPVVTWDQVRADCQGLVALSGLQRGRLGQLIAAGQLQGCRDWLAECTAVFDDQRFHVDICRVGAQGEEAYNDAAMVLAAEAGIPVVATNDVRFLAREDFEAHEARVCIASGRVLADPARPRLTTPEQYLKTAEQMAEVFVDCPAALSNTVELSRRLNLEMKLGTYYLPDFPLPEGETVETHLEKESIAGLERRYRRIGIADGYTDADYRARLNHELGVINQMGFPGYFLIVADFIRWARDNGIPVGPGRGSGAGSLVAYVLEITDLDPLEHELLFERFLNPERVSMPDFDVDFCMDRRDEVIDYVAQRYGREKVCQIITYGSMNAKAVIRDVGRVLGHPYGFVDSIAKLIPMTLGITLAEAIKESDDLRTRVETDEDVGELMELAMGLEGLTRNAGKHAGGVVIAPGDLTEFSPLYSEAGSDSIVTQFDKDDVESVGLVKFDFLGLRTLTIIDWALAAINRRRADDGDDAIDIMKLPMDDLPTYQLLQACNTTAVFQLESRGMKDLIGRLKPGDFNDIVALVALFRPGPLDSGMVDTYVDCKHGRQEVVYQHPELQPILDTTYGVILYQEQVMQIAQSMAGYSLGGADILRRAMGKKKPAEMAKQRDIFVSGSEKRGIDGQLAESIFDLMEKFAGYGFNKSHSAAYALLAYQTAWLKAHYPAEFMAAVLSADMENTDKVVNLIEDARSQGLTIGPPDVNQSCYQFVASKPDWVVYGLGAIKGVGRAVIEGIVAAREAGGDFMDLVDFCRRVDLSRVNRRVFDTLILSGAMDSLGHSRAMMAENLGDVLKLAEQESRNRESGQVDLFGAPEQASEPTIKMREVAEWTDNDRLAGERSTLGLYLTGHPIQPWLKALARITSTRLAQLGEFYRPAPEHERPRKGRRPTGQLCILAGLVMQVRRRDNAIFFVLDDHGGRVEVAVFKKGLDEAIEVARRDEIVVVEGGLLPDEFTQGFSLRATRVLSVEDAIAEYSRGVRVTLADGADVGQLLNCLGSHPGNQPVFVDFCNNQAAGTLRLGENVQIKPTMALQQALAKLEFVDESRLLFPSDFNRH